MLLELIKDQTFLFEIVYIYVNMTYCSNNEKEKKKLPMIYSYKVIMREFPQGPKLQVFFRTIEWWIWESTWEMGWGATWMRNFILFFYFGTIQFKKSSNIAKKDMKNGPSMVFLKPKFLVLKFITKYFCPRIRHLS